MNETLRFLLVSAIITVSTAGWAGAPAMTATVTGKSAVSAPAAPASKVPAKPVPPTAPAGVPAMTATGTGASAATPVKAPEKVVPANDVLVQAVAIEGTVNVKPSDIAAKLRTRIGVQPTPDTLREDVKAIWDMGTFDDVSVDATEVPGGLRVSFLVKERPIIREIRFVNAKEFSDKDLKDKVAVQPGDSYDPSKGREAENALGQAYHEKGYPDAVVLATLEPIEREKERGKMDLVFEVKEGTKFHVRKITFGGNKLFPEGALKKVLKNKEAMFFFQSGTFMKDEIEKDCQRLVEFYKNEGYQKARVITSEVLETPKKEKDAVDLKFTLEEGKLYNLKSIKFQGNTLTNEKELRENLEMKEGEKLSQRRLDEGLARIRDIYTERGYIYAAVLPDIAFNDDKAEGDLTLRFHEGTVAFIDRILIRGNEETKDKVILREILVKPGDQFDTRKVRKSMERIYNLGFFEDVRPYTEPSMESGKENLIFDVKERQTGTVSLGGGYSSQFGFVGFLQLTKANLFGLGIRIGAEWEFGQKRQNMTLDYFDPYFWDTPVSLGLGYWDTRRDLTGNFTQRSQGGSVSFGYRPAEDWRVTLGYKYQVDKVTKYDDIPLPTGVTEDPLATSSPSLTVNYDDRDNIFDPMRGWSHQWFAQVAGGPYPRGGINFIGGDTRYYKVLYDASYFQPSPVRLMPFIGKPSLALHMRTGRAWGFGGQDVPIFERFFLGGTDSIRGYKERQLGPVDPLTNQSSGGRAMWQFNTELKWPLFPRILTLAAPFYDIGNAWAYSPFSRSKEEKAANPLAQSVGIGIRLTIPNTILVVRLDYGWGRTKEYHPDSSGAFHFNIGNIF